MAEPIAKVDLGKQVEVEMYFCHLCMSGFLARGNTTSEDICPQCLEDLERARVAESGGGGGVHRLERLER